MALSANTVLEVRTGGNDGNGGGFVAGASGVDRSQQDAPHVTIDGATITATVHTTTTQLNLTGHTVAAADVGNVVRISGGTMTAGWYEITAADTGNNRWTLDRSGGTAGQTGTGRMGGALASPGGLGALLAAAAVSGMVCWVKTGTFTYNNSTPNTSGGPLSTPASAINLAIHGYNATRGDLHGQAAIDNKPVIDAGSIGSITMFTGGTSGNPGQILSSVVFDGNKSAASAVAGINIGTRWKAVGVHVRDCDGVGITLSGGAADGCEAFGNTSHGFSTPNNCEGCSSHHNGGNGFNGGSDAYASGLLAYRNTGVGILGGTRSNFAGCTSAFNDGDGFDGGGVGSMAADCIAYGNGGFGYDNVGYLVKCASGSNTSGRDDGSVLGDLAPIALTDDPFTDSDADDYSLNNTAGGGAELRGAALQYPDQP